MAITRRTAVETINSTAVGSYTITKPTGLADNDFAILYIAMNGGTFTSPPTGFTLIKNELTQSNPKYLIYGKYITSVAGEGTWTVTHSLVNSTTIAQAYSGVDATTQIDVTPLSGTNSTGSNTMTVAQVTTTVNDCLLIYGAAINSSSNALSPPAGMTEDLETSGTKKQCADFESRPTAGATGSRAGAAVSNTLAWAAIMFALRPAATAAPGFPRPHRKFRSTLVRM